MRNRIQHPELRQVAERADLLVEMGDFESAVSVWTDYIARAPHSAAAHFERGEVRALAGVDAIGMLEDYKAATDLDPSDPHFRFVFNLTFGSTLQCAFVEEECASLLDEAIRRFELAITAAPFELEGYNYRGTAYLMKNDVTRALSDFSIATELDAHDGYAYLMRGMLAFDNGQLAMAKDELETAIEFRSTLPDEYQELLDSRYQAVVAELVGS